MDDASKTGPAVSPRAVLPIRRLGPAGYAICAAGIARREFLRFVNQKERFFSALVRPLVWLFIFAAGFRNVLGVSIIPPYETYVLYEVYVTPGLAAMIQLFNGMQSSLSMVYDREVGSMRVLLTSPLSALVPALRQARGRGRRVARPGLRLPRHRAVLGGRGSVARLPDGAAGLHALGADARRDRALPVLARPPARELRERDELRDLPDVLRLLGALSRSGASANRARRSIYLRVRTRSPMRSSSSGTRSTVVRAGLVCVVSLVTTSRFSWSPCSPTIPAAASMARRGGPQGEAS